MNRKVTNQSSKNHRGNVLVTGGALRVGNGIVRSFAQKGWNVAIHYRHSKKEAEQLAEEISSDNPCRAVVLQADLTNEEETCRLPVQAAQALGSLDCLINNASTFLNDTVQEHSASVWEENMATNLRAPFLLSMEFAKIAPRESNANIVHIIDERVWNLTPHFLSYTVSKTGLWTLTRTLAMALAPHIRVNAVGPGLIIPDASLTEKQFKNLYGKLPLRRPGSIQEMCDAIHFFLNAPSVTGQMISVDAGQHLGWGHVFDSGVSGAT